MFDAKKTKNEIVEWIKEYFMDNGPNCVAVVGISGGKDSSVVASLCLEALGKDRVFGVLMPQGEQSDIDVSQKLVKYLGIKYETVNIGDTAGSLLNMLEDIFGKQNYQARVNTPARIRMATLYAVSAYVGGRVANTCNLSEDYIGYSTKYGDSAGDFSPLSHLTVTEVKAVGRELGLPSEFVDKTPTDGLSGKTDEDNFGFKYDVLDRYIREGICEDKFVKEKIDHLNKINLHKLNLMPAFQPK